jgi:LacI family transcriptional regulator
MLKTSRKKNGTPATAASISDVAKAAGVSLGTASRVFNGCENVAGDLRKQVWLAARNAGYTPRRRAKCVGILCGRRSPGMAFGYVNVMSSLLMDSFMKRGFSVELIDGDHLEQACQSHLTGIAGIVFDDRLKELARIPNLPVLAVNCDMAAQGISSIFADHFEQGHMAASHLIKSGHKSAGYLAIDLKEQGCAARIAGCRAAFKEHGLPEDAVLVESTLEHKAYDILKRWTGNGVKAVFNFSEDCALETIHILSNVLNLRIGADVSVISI